jgi:hypothetical protein
MKRGEYEAFFGGAAGGGKSDCLVIEALRQVNVPNYKALILRKTYDSLKELVEKSMYYYPQACKKARFNGSALTWTFPSGAKIRFGNVQAKNFKTKYQGQQYDFIAFDELTHFTWEEYSWFFSRNRPSGPGTVCYIRSTGNPGGIGHGWVKNRFVTPMPAGTPIKEKTSIDGPGGTKYEFDRSRVFIPSTVFDNQILLKNDPNYLASLDALPAAERAALLEGNWDSFHGQCFTEWRCDPTHYEDQRWTHVIAPFDIPKHWEIIRSFDWGHSRPFSVGWTALDTEGRMYRIRELYGCKAGQPNVGVEWPDQKIAQEILRIEKEDPNIRGHNVIGVADPAIGLKKADSGYGAAAAMAEMGVYFSRGKNDRMLGKMQFHYRLAFNAEGRPMFQVFNTCRHFIEQIPSLVYSETDVEDIDTTQEDHIYDECRYAFCTHIISKPIPAPSEEKPAEDDPLNLKADREKTRFLRY